MVILIFFSLCSPLTAQNWFVCTCACSKPFPKIVLMVKLVPYCQKRHWLTKNLFSWRAPSGTCRSVPTSWKSLWSTGASFKEFALDIAPFFILSFDTFMLLVLSQPMIDYADLKLSIGISCADVSLGCKSDGLSCQQLLSCYVLSPFPQREDIHSFRVCITNG